MTRLTSSLRTRLLAAVLTATGVSFLAAGLLSYTGTAEAGPLPEPSQVVIAVQPTPTAPLPTFPPVSAAPSASASPSPSAVVDRVATRVVVPALKIDLPVIKPAGGSGAYPQCNVAMYIQELHQPGQGGATYLYAHARAGMFGPIYNLAIVKKTPNAMVGKLVYVYTSDDKLFIYEITEVRVHQLDLNDALDATTEELWLQTSEGPRGTPGKTQVKAVLLIVEDADHAEAHPRARPVNCG